MMGLGLCEFEPDAVVEKPIATALSPDALVVNPTATASLPRAEVPAQPIVGHVFPFCGVIAVTSATKAHSRRSVWRSEDIAATGVAPPGAKPAIPPTTTTQPKPLCRHRRAAWWRRGSPRVQWGLRAVYEKV